MALYLFFLASFWPFDHSLHYCLMQLWKFDLCAQPVLILPNAHFASVVVLRKHSICLCLCGNMQHLDCNQHAAYLFFLFSIKKAKRRNDKLDCLLFYFIPFLYITGSAVRFIFLDSSRPLGIYFATASKDNTARIWTLERTYPLRVLAGHNMDVDVR